MRSKNPSPDARFMRAALQLARRGLGATSPNPMVGAVLVKAGRIIGRGWHRQAGKPHAEVEAIRDAQRRKAFTSGATLYVTLEPCCTHGRTPPCTAAIIEAGIRRVVIGTTDPNPKHRGRGLRILRRAGIDAVTLDQIRPDNKTLRAIANECTRLNEAFNHWIVHRTPLVLVKSAMTIDGKIATASGESKWITSESARRFGMRLRQGVDAILVGVNTIIADDPSLTFRKVRERGSNVQRSKSKVQSPKALHRIVLDSHARIPLTARVLNDELASMTTVVVAHSASARRVAALRRHATVMVAPPRRIRNPQSAIPLAWLLQQLGKRNIISLLVEGGGEVNASFLLSGLAHRIAFFYAPKILGGRDSRPAVGGPGAASLAEALNLEDIEWRRLGPDLLLTARLSCTKRRKPYL